VVLEDPEAVSVEVLTEHAAAVAQELAVAPLELVVSLAPQAASRTMLAGIARRAAIRRGPMRAWWEWNTAADGTRGLQMRGLAVQSALCP
jgi:hypothetical protein